MKPFCIITIICFFTLFLCENYNSII